MTEASTHMAGDPGAADPAGGSFEHLLISLSARFISLPAGSIDGEVEAAQRLICQCLALDRSTLWQFSDADRTLLLTHHAPGSSPLPFGTNGLEAFPWLGDRVLRREVTLITTLDDLPAEAERDKAGLRQARTRSTAVFPVVARERVIGCVTFVQTTRERVWSEIEARRFQLVAQVFANALDRKRADRELRQALTEIEQLRDQLRHENMYLYKEIRRQQDPARVFGRSAAIRSALDQARRVAPTPSTVLLFGETGVGKELFANVIHDASPRRDRVMVRVNCSAIPTALIESELFGREKGAYTGALSKQIGRFELAHGSTIFLDEIGDLPIETQLKLLRVLQERQIERLGSPRSLPVDVRVIAATNRNLEEAIERGTFRQDLYYRLNVFPLTVPPLRERSEDIPLLVSEIVEEFATAMGRRVDAISQESMAQLVAYGWPGNVRELRNVIERAMILANGRTLRVALPLSVPAGPRSGCAGSLRWSWSWSSVRPVPVRRRRFYEGSCPHRRP